MFAAPTQSVMHSETLRSTPYIHRSHDQTVFCYSACVARPVDRKERVANPKAKAALDKEWNKLITQGCWDYDTVREWSDVSAEARKTGAVAHVGRIFDICVEKLFWLTDLHVVNGVNSASCRHGLVNRGGHLLQTCAYLHLVLFQLALCQCRMGFFCRGFFTSPSPLEEEIMSSFGTDFCGLIADGVGPTRSSAHPPARSFELRDRCVDKELFSLGGSLDGSMSSPTCHAPSWDTFAVVHLCMHAFVSQAYAGPFASSFCGNGSIDCHNCSGFCSLANTGNGHFQSTTNTTLLHQRKRSPISLFHDDDG